MGTNCQGCNPRELTAEALRRFARLPYSPMSQSGTYWAPLALRDWV